MDRITRRRAILNIAGSRLVYSRNANENPDEFEYSSDEDMEIQQPAEFEAGENEFEAGENVENQQPRNVDAVENVVIEQPNETNENIEETENSFNTVAEMEIGQPDARETAENSPESGNNNVIDEPDLLANVTVELANISIIENNGKMIFSAKKYNKFISALRTFNLWLL